MGVERILNSHARNKVLSGLLCNDIYGDLDGVSKNLEAPIKIVEYIKELTYGLSWDNGVSSKTTYDTFVDYNSATRCIQTNCNILQNVIAEMDKYSQKSVDYLGIIYLLRV